MRQGRDLEDYVARRFTEATGKKVRRKNEILKSAEYPFMLANVDRLVVGENAGLECKTTSVLNLKRFKNGEYPAEYYCQCFHYMAVTGFRKWYLAVLVLGAEFRYYEIEWDDEEVNNLIFAEKDFWGNHVQKQIPPVPDGSKSAGAAIKSIYPHGEEDNVADLSNYNTDLEKYASLDAQIKASEKEKDAVKQKI